MATPNASSRAPAEPATFGGACAAPQPDPDRIRRRLEAILDAMRGEQKMAWDFSVQLVYQRIFPDMTQFLRRRGRALSRRLREGMVEARVPVKPGAQIFR